MIELKRTIGLRLFALFEEELKLFPLFILGHISLFIWNIHIPIPKELGS